MTPNERAAAVARALLEIDAVVFTPDAPITFKSGIKSPVYVDNRRVPFWPDQWRVVLEGFAQAARGLSFDVIAGIAVGTAPRWPITWGGRRSSCARRPRSTARAARSKAAT